MSTSWRNLHQGRDHLHIILRLESSSLSIRMQNSAAEWKTVAGVSFLPSFLTGFLSVSLFVPSSWRRSKMHVIQTRRKIMMMRTMMAAWRPSIGFSQSIHGGGDDFHEKFETRAEEKWPTHDADYLISHAICKWASRFTGALRFFSHRGGTVPHALAGSLPGFTEFFFFYRVSGCAAVRWRG